VSNAGWEPEHHTIVTLDIEGFGSPTRTDPIRAGLRRSLQAIITGAQGKLSDPEPVRAVGDTGDGKWLLFHPGVPKTAVLGVFIPALETELRHHNSGASTAARIRLRIAVHHGDVIPDDGGYSGEPLNHAFRLIDNDVIRQALAASSQNSVTAVSADFFEKIIRPGYGSLDPENFSPVSIQVKELSTTAWINQPLQESMASCVASGGAPRPEAAAKLEQKVLTIADLPPTSLYIAISDIHNAALYGRGFPEVPLSQHFETALLLGRKVVVHCADSYRSPIVSEILESFEPCIESGDLLFLLGENAQNPSGHFRGYIDYKVTQYGKSQYGSRDVVSLTRVEENSTVRTERFLSLSPYALIRGFSGTDGFLHCAKRDLQPGEPVTIHDNFSMSVLGGLSLTIRQILELTRPGRDGRLVRAVADETTVDRLQTEVNRLVGHNSFSRQIFMEAIRRVTGLPEDDAVSQAFGERVSLLHLMGTIGSLGHLEVTSRRDRASAHYHGHLLDHLSMLSEVQHPTTFGPSLVMELRALPCWSFFAAYHLQIVGQAVQRLGSNGDWPADLNTAFRWTRRMPEFDPIRSVVRTHWR
jgi:hypothetical protein